MIADRIKLITGDITVLKVDAIVNAANRTLLGGGGVDGAIHRAAGPGLLAECRTLGGCRTGEAKITGGYDLPAAHVIHTVGPVYRGRPSDAADLASCYRNSLDLAERHGLRTIAFSAVSCGVYGYPAGEAAAIVAGTVAEWLERHPDSPLTVYLVCFGAEIRRAYEDALARLRERS